MRSRANILPRFSFAAWYFSAPPRRISALSWGRSWCGRVCCGTPVSVIVGNSLVVLNTLRARVCQLRSFGQCADRVLDHTRVVRLGQHDDLVDPGVPVVVEGGADLVQVAEGRDRAQHLLR